MASNPVLILRSTIPGSWLSTNLTCCSGRKTTSQLEVLVSKNPLLDFLPFTWALLLSPQVQLLWGGFRKICPPLRALSLGAPGFLPFSLSLFFLLFLFLLLLGISYRISLPFWVWGLPACIQWCSVGIVPTHCSWFFICLRRKVSHLSPLPSSTSLPVNITLWVF